MKLLPPEVTAYKKTPVFNQDSIPAGLRKAHQTKDGTWGCIVIQQGALLYRILEPDLEEVQLSPSLHGVVEPQVLHEVEPSGPVEFYVEFYK